MTNHTLINAGVLLGVTYVARLWARWRVERVKAIALTTPLVDAVLVETVFAPREGDDPDLLAEMRDTLLHLNRRAYAEEFWSLHKQLTALDAKLGSTQKATLRQALLRLLGTGDRWLQIVAAKTAADLNATEAIAPITQLLEQTPGSADDPVTERFRDELQAALASLTQSTNL